VADALIRGDGVAARCAAHLLEKARLCVAWTPADRPRLPAILLGEAAQALVRDVFERPDLFRGLHKIAKRIVAWQPGVDAMEVEHSAVVVSEQDLLDRLRPSFERAEDAHAGWTMFSTRPLPPESQEHSFGSRIASAVPVDLTGEANACSIEGLNEGWLFLIPDAPASGWLLSVGGAPDDLLGRSQVIAKQIAGVGAPAGQFPAYPRITAPLGGTGWLACGTAAMAFDPICGDGTGHAIREAILAAAVIRAAFEGADAVALVAHYERRLKLGFERHLGLCREFYQSGRRGAWWDREVAALDQGLDWCRSMGDSSRFQFQLDGFELRPIGVEARP
jgi:hypothetical protein